MKIECRDTLRIKLKGRWKNAIYLFNRTDSNPLLPEFWDTEKDVIMGHQYPWLGMVFLRRLGKYGFSRRGYSDNIEE